MTEVANSDYRCNGHRISRYFCDRHKGRQRTPSTTAATHLQSCDPDVGAWSRSARGERLSQWQHPFDSPSAPPPPPAFASHDERLRCRTWTRGSQLRFSRTNATRWTPSMPWSLAGRRGSPARGVTRAAPAAVPVSGTARPRRREEERAADRSIGCAGRGRMTVPWRPVSALARPPLRWRRRTRHRQRSLCRLARA